MMQIYFKPSYRKMIIRAVRPTGDTLNDIIVSCDVCNPVSYDEFINAKRYKFKDYSIKSTFEYKYKELKDGKMHRI